MRESGPNPLNNPSRQEPREEDLKPLAYKQISTTDEEKSAGKEAKRVAALRRENLDWNEDRLPEHTVLMSIGGAYPSKERIKRYKRARATADARGGGEFIARGSEGSVYRHPEEPGTKVTKVLYGTPVKRSGEGEFVREEFFDVNNVPAEVRRELLKQHLLTKICAQLFPGVIPDEYDFRTKFEPFQDRERIDSNDPAQRNSHKVRRLQKEFKALGVHLDDANTAGNFMHRTDGGLIYYDAFYVPDPKRTATALFRAVQKMKTSPQNRQGLLLKVRRFAQLSGLDASRFDSATQESWWQRLGSMLRWRP